MRFARPAAATLLVFVLASALSLAGGIGVPRARAQMPDPIRDNGGFESGTTGWIALASSTIASDAAAPLFAGAKSAKLTSTSASQSGIRSQYWLSPASAPKQYTATVAVRYETASINSVTVRLDILNASGSAPSLATANATLNSQSRGGVSGGDDRHAHGACRGDVAADHSPRGHDCARYGHLDRRREHQRGDTAAATGTTARSAALR